MPLIASVAARPTRSILNHTSPPISPNSLIPSCTSGRCIRLPLVISRTGKRPARPQPSTTWRTQRTADANSAALVGSPLPEKGHIDQATRAVWHFTRQEIAVQQIVEKARQLALEPPEIDGRRAAARQVVDLAIDAGPVAGIVHIQVDAHRNAPGTTGDDRVNIEQSRTVAAMVFNGQHAAIV